MEYRYLLEERSNKDIILEDINNESMFYILCYHIDNQYKYPFLQFMMEKVPFCAGLIKEQLTLPYLIVNCELMDIELAVLNKVKLYLNNIGCDYLKVSEEMYKGIVIDNETGVPYALVNITGIDIYGLNFGRNSSPWFVLTSEIINTTMVCNIPIDKDVVDFFSDYDFIGCLTNPTTGIRYILPDAVYTGCEIQTAKFNSVFGNIKSKVYDSCGEYFYFYRTFSESVREGGWKRENIGDKIGDKIGDRIIVENNGKYINGAINRYALFIEGKIYLETEKEFKLSDETIESLYPEPTIIICYTGTHNVKPDILVKDYNSFVCLSYHSLNRNLLKEYYDETDKKEFMIL